MFDSLCEDSTRNIKGCIRDSSHIENIYLILKRGRSGSDESFLRRNCSGANERNHLKDCKLNIVFNLPLQHRRLHECYPPIIQPYFRDNMIFVLKLADISNLVTSTSFLHRLSGNPRNSDNHDNFASTECHACEGTKKLIFQL